METNDPDHAKFDLKLTGTVNEFLKITPYFAVLKGTVGEKITQTVTVIPGEKVKIITSNTLNQDDFKYTMSEIEKDGKKVYQFLIENTKTSPGKYLGKIFLYTNIAENNPATIHVTGDIKPAEKEIKSNE